MGVVAVIVVVIAVAGSPAAMAAGEGSDLVLSALSDPPSTAVRGSSFQATDTTANIGIAASVESTTVFALVLATDFQQQYLLGTRTVPPLAGSTSSTVDTQVTIPIDTAPGEYRFAACADFENANIESPDPQDPLETNNCFLDDTVSIVVTTTQPSDLTIANVANPPAKRYRGQSMSVTDTTGNDGSGKSPISATRYLLSTNELIGDEDDVLIPQQRLVPRIPAGGSNTGGTTVSIPMATPLDSYFLVACADGPDQINELDETNNCGAAATKVTIGPARADLVVKAVNKPPEERTRGGKFTVTDTTMNKGSIASAQSQTWYRLSTDKQVGADKALIGARSVPGLPVGGQHQGSKQVTIPDTTAPGLYFVLACADGGLVVSELSEKNNCRASTTQIRVRKG